MADITSQVEVRLWDQRVGALVELDNGPLVFEYAPAFRRSGLEISPLHLPLRLEGPLRFDELRRSAAFEGLPGVLADALPDAFGNKVIRAYFAARGQEARAMSPAQRLLYVGARALGALTFHPAEELSLRPAEEQALEIAGLVEDARRIIEGSPDIAIPEMYRIGSSAGGMRPKAVVSFNPETSELRSGHAEASPGAFPAILKFDGVGDGSSTGTLGGPLPYNRVEAAYARMARAAGIDMAQVRMLEHGPHAHLVIRRFDITDAGERLHQHTLGGLIHVDYNEPGASSYEEYLRTILALGMPHASLVEGYRRVVFNVLAVNQDDHVKNLSFHMDGEGAWRLAPAYDLTFAKGHGWTSRHQMQVNGRTEGITQADLLALAQGMGVTRPNRIVEQVRTAVASFGQFAGEVAVAREVRARVQKELRARDGQVFAEG